MNGASADTKSELEAAEDRLAQIQNQIDAQEAKLDRLQAALNDLAAKLDAAQNEYDAIRLEVVRTRRGIEEAERELRGLQTSLNEHARQAYMAGPAESLEFLLGAASLADLSDRLEFLEAEAQQDADLATGVENQLNLLNRQRADLERMLARQAELLRDLRAQRRDLAARFAEQQRAYDRLVWLRSEAASLVEKLEGRLEREQLAQAGTVIVDGPGPLYVCPVAGPRAYASTFGQIHNHPGWTHAHQGNDILSPYGTPIVAPFDGYAVQSTGSTSGLMVTVSGAQGSAVMMHMSRFGAAGSVRAGDVIGYIGTSGNATTPHTHFEWHPGGGAAVDPYPYLNEVC
ncbi:MAG: hypothetical protein KatS3mg014_0012 [Actinomycetota bacterium]|nr:MAG: hypothetical protein KatS3mg014_0012 [Actinomycetota bacterium]